MFKLFGFILFACCIVSVASAQDSFPRSWVGEWKGELKWHTKVGAKPKGIPMELKIQATENAGEWEWTMIYGDTLVDVRNYILKGIDTAVGRWVIDEGIGIVLDQKLIGGRLTGAFAVGENFIFNTYYMEHGKLMVEFITVTAKPTGETGSGNEVSPKVFNHGILGYQKAVLERVSQ